MGHYGESVSVQTITNKKCPSCSKSFKIVLDNGIPLPAQTCQHCGFKII